ncbi:acetoacetate decarboxylase family protein [Congregibacter sp.]|uniref:acetoacetate decarboxylase family protein n=1 Tax=Congregibacter sp. TaxID=2744308 RepID=UPI003F6D1021
MFKLDPAQPHIMPAHFGPRYTGEKTSGWYRDVTVMAVSYVTDREKLAGHIPAPFKLPEQATITVFYACNKQIDWLAGFGYNMIGVNAAVIFEGEHEQLTGSYSLVIWENLTDPILVGREVQGIPKIYADIPDHSVNGDVWRCNASHFGHKIVDLSIADLVPVSREDIEAGEASAKATDNPMTWRYMPGLGGYGAPAVNDAVLYPSENKFSEVHVGVGELEWQKLLWEQNPTQYHIVNALNALPVLEYLPAVVTKGSANLVVPERLTRALGPVASQN